MKIQLADDLEKALLRAIAEGVCKSNILEIEELSKEGKHVFKAINYLLSKSNPPLKPASIYLTATAVEGAEEDEVRAYLKGFAGLGTGEELVSILKAARDKALLVKVINAAGSQLTEGSLKPNVIRQLLESSCTQPDLRTFASSVGNKFPEPPRGRPLGSLPRITEYTRGINGIWIIGGEPGLGKSTLSWQIALDYGRVAPAYPILYYDLDDTGYSWFIERTRSVVRGSIKEFHRWTDKIYYRETISTLENDLSIIKPPALIVVDSLQALPTSLRFKKESIDAWIGQFKDLTKRGYVVLAVSEINRAGYGETNMKGFKGSGDIEYGGTMCAQLIQAEDDNSLLEVHIVKNRHGVKKGHAVNLERDEKKIFWFNEEAI